MSICKGSLLFWPNDLWLILWVSSFSGPFFVLIINVLSPWHLLYWDFSAGLLQQVHKMFRLIKKGSARPEDKIDKTLYWGNSYMTWQRWGKRYRRYITHLQQLSLEYSEFIGMDQKWSANTYTYRSVVMYLIRVYRCEISVSRLEAEVRQDTERGWVLAYIELH